MPFFTASKLRIWKVTLKLAFCFSSPSFYSILVVLLHPLKKKKVAMLAVWLIIYPVKEEVFPVTFPSIQFEFLNGFLINKVSSITPMINQGIWARKKWTLGSWDAFSKIFLVNIWYTIVIYSCDANTEFIKPLLQSSVTHDPWCRTQAQHLFALTRCQFL